MHFIITLTYMIKSQFWYAVFCFLFS